MIIPPSEEPVSQTKPIFESIENAHAFGTAAMKQVWPDINITIDKVEKICLKEFFIPSHL